MDLTSGPVGRTLLIFALPVLGSNVLSNLNGFINSIWVGKYLGQSALAATSNVNIILFTLFASVFGVGMASTILVGQAVGARQFDEAKRVFGTGATFFAVIALSVTAVGCVLAPNILDAMRTPPDARAYAIAYLRVIFLAMPSMYFFLFLMVTLRGAGDSKTPFYFMAVSVALDIGLNPVFLQGLCGAPKMGIAGAATATLISQTVCFIGLLVYLYKKKHFLCLYGREFRYLLPNRVILRSLLVKGLPMGMQMVVMSTSGIALMSMVNSYGSQTTAAYGVATQVWGYVQMPAFALGAGVSAMAAQNLGAKRWDRITSITWSGLGLNMLLTGIPALIILIFCRTILGWILPDGASGEAATIGVHINGIAIWSYVLFGITVVLFGVVRSTGAVMAPLGVLFVSLWVIRIPFAKVFSAQMGADAIWWSFPVGSVIAAGLAALYYWNGSWKRAHMIKATPGATEAEVAMANIEA